MLGDAVDEDLYRVERSTELWDVAVSERSSQLASGSDGRGERWDKKSYAGAVPTEPSAPTAAGSGAEPLLPAPGAW